MGVLSFTEEDALEAFCKQVQVNGTLECSVECVHLSESQGLTCQDLWGTGDRRQELGRAQLGNKKA